LPKSWIGDEDLRKKAQIPEDVTFKKKWEIALELLKKAVKGKVPFKFLTADELYGRVGDFRKSVSELGITYVVEVPCDLEGWVKKPKTVALFDSTEEDSSTGLQLAIGSPSPRRVDQLWQRGGPSWQVYHVKDTGEGPVVWEVRHTVFYVSRDGLPFEKTRLMIARNVLTGEVKYFLSNASLEIPVEKLLHIAFNRWRIERLFEDAKIILFLLLLPFLLFQQ